MALDHFHLSRPPFSPAHDPVFHYEDAARRELLGALQYALRLGDGVVKVTGEPGSGKTMLCAVLAARLAQDSPPVQAVVLERAVNAAGIAMSPQDAVCSIARQLGLAPGGLRSDEIMRLLHAHLAAERAAGRLAVLLVEESQALPADTLETLRQLTNLSEGAHALLPVVLLGTSELSNVLRQPRLRQLRERITLSFVLPAPSPELAPELLAHRLRAAGHADGALFQLDAARLIARSGGADLHALIALADKSLAVAANASAPAVAMFHVRDAIKGAAGKTAPEALSAWDTAPAPGARLSTVPAPTAPGEPAAETAVAAAPEPEAAPQPKVMGKPGAVAQPEAAAPPGAVAGPERVAEPDALVLPAPVLEPGPRPVADIVVAPDLPTPALPRPRSAARGAMVAGGAMLAVSGVAIAAFMLGPAFAPAVTAQAPATLPVTQASPPVQMALRATEPVKSETAAAPVAAATARKALQAASAAPSAIAQPAHAVAPQPRVAVPPAQFAAPPLPPAGLLKQSLRASETWLRDEPDSNFCVQIENFSATETQRAEQFLADTRAAIGLSEVHTYPMLIKGERRIAVVYGSFSSAKKVQEVQATLAERSGTHHKIRTIKGIRAAVLLAGKDGGSTR